MLPVYFSHLVCVLCAKTAELTFVSMRVCQGQEDFPDFNALCNMLQYHLIWKSQISCIISTVGQLSALGRRLLCSSKTGYEAEIQTFFHGRCVLQGFVRKLQEAKLKAKRKKKKDMNKWTRLTPLVLNASWCRCFCSRLASVSLGLSVSYSPPLPFLQFNILPAHREHMTFTELPPPPLHLPSPPPPPPFPHPSFVSQHQTS